MTAPWFPLFEKWLVLGPISGNITGLRKVCDNLETNLVELGFTVDRHQDQEEKDSPDILVAVRPPTPFKGSVPWVGLTAHYDVEAIKHPGKWHTKPFQLTHKDGRVYARGIGDNLGPLAQRLTCLRECIAAKDPLPGMVWVIHGQEEIGSPFAHRLYPSIWQTHAVSETLQTLPSVSVWMEESGYFEKDGRQRLLVNNLDTLLEDAPVLQAIGRVVQLANGAGREVNKQVRFMNKTFREGCPCLAHLVGQTPYVAIGPNDVLTDIHRPNESLPADSLDLSATQFKEFLSALATAAPSTPTTSVRPQTSTTTSPKRKEEVLVAESQKLRNGGEDA